MLSFLQSGKSNIPIQEKTVSIIYGADLVNLSTLNFVAIGDDIEIAKVRPR